MAESSAKLKMQPHPKYSDAFLVNSKQISCKGDGQKGDLGHPLVYLEIKKNGHIKCPYCSRQFFYSN
jgi:uncharacterized Zn-finger protein